MTILVFTWSPGALAAGFDQFLGSAATLEEAKQGFELWLYEQVALQKAHQDQSQAQKPLGPNMMWPPYGIIVQYVAMNPPMLLETRETEVNHTTGLRSEWIRNADLTLTKVL